MSRSTHMHTHTLRGNFKCVCPVCSCFHCFFSMLSTSRASYRMCSQVFLPSLVLLRIDSDFRRASTSCNCLSLTLSLLGLVLVLLLLTLIFFPSFLVFHIILISLLVIPLNICSFLFAVFLFCVVPSFLLSSLLPLLYLVIFPSANHTFLPTSPSCLPILLFLIPFLFQTPTLPVLPPHILTPPYSAASFHNPHSVMAQAGGYSSPGVV